MTAKQIVKINFLILGFGLCLYAIYTLNARGLPNPILSILGLPQNAHVAAHDVASAQDVNLCKTRVLGLIQPEKLKLIQNGNQWIAEKPESQAVDFIAVEKWLSRFCSAKALPGSAAKASTLASKASLANGFTPALFVKFIDGAVDVLRSDSSGRFEYNGQIFRSNDLAQALAELVTLPKAKSNSEAPKGN